MRERRKSLNVEPNDVETFIVKTMLVVRERNLRVWDQQSLNHDYFELDIDDLVMDFLGVPPDRYFDGPIGEAVDAPGQYSREHLSEISDKCSDEDSIRWFVRMLKKEAAEPFSQPDEDDPFYRALMDAPMD
jgi:hypothetical protein